MSTHIDVPSHGALSKAIQAGILACTVDGTRKVEEGGDRHVEYILSVTLDSPSTNDYDEQQCWKVTRRFRSFADLHHRLSDVAKFEGIAMPPLPPKTFFRNSNPNSTLSRQRKEQLDAYMKQLLAYECMAAHPLVQEFLELNIHALVPTRSLLTSGTITTTHYSATAVQDWTDGQVEEWLLAVLPRFKEYLPGFRKNCIDGHGLLELLHHSEDVQQLGIPSGPLTRRLLREIESLRSSNPRTDLVPSSNSPSLSQSSPVFGFSSHSPASQSHAAFPTAPLHHRQDSSHVSPPLS